jgi:hypothetical protein
MPDSEVFSIQNPAESMGLISDPLFSRLLARHGGISRRLARCFVCQHKFARADVRFGYQQFHRSRMLECFQAYVEQKMKTV